MKFLKTFLASLLGTLIAIFLIIAILFGILVSSSSDPEPYVRSNSVLTINLSGDIPERISPDPFEELFNPDLARGVSLRSLKSNLEKAAADDKIEGIWVKTNFVSASWAHLETAHRYFDEFKESGKFIYFSTDDIGMNEKSYYLATTADSIFSPPETGFEFDGFVAQFSFYRGFFDKIGIEPEIIRVGKYKSAVEPFMNRESSPESREQTREILEAASSVFVDAVANRIDKTPDEVNTMLNTPPIDRLQFALDNGLIDAFAYDDEVEKKIKTRLEVDEDSDLQTISFKRYSRVSASSAGLEREDTSNKIAVLYSSGMIAPDLGSSPFGGSSGITAASIKSQLDSALEDDDIKAIVIHVNSGGGAPSTSDAIWHYLKQASEKKPVVASMGNVAASGGYYIAIGADTVVANANTITGSIGIFNLMFNAQELLNENIGLEFENLTTHEYADLFDLTRPMNAAERRVMERNIENGYESFLNVVATSRGMTRDEVHEVAQGRVYTGTAALEAGLIDVIGDLDRAIEIAAEMAEIDAYTLDTYPKRKDIFESLFGSANSTVQTWVRSWVPGPVRSEYDTIEFMMNHPKGQNWAVFPFHIDVN